MMSQRRSAVATGLVIAALSFTGRVNAQPNDGKAAAEVLFQAGQRLLSEGKLEIACQKFEESERLDHALGTMLNIANCYEKSGRTASAWAMYREVANLAQTKHDTGREGFATSHAEALAPRLSTLTIVVADGQGGDGLVIKRDGVPIGQALWGMPTPVDPGDHKIEVSAPGRRTWTTVAKVEADASKSTVSIPQLDQEPVAPPPAGLVETDTPRPADEPQGGWSTQRTIGVAVAGAGIVGVGIGAAFGLVAKSKYSDALTHCVGSKCDAEGLSLTDSAKGAATGSTIAFVIGGAALATGAVLYFTAPKGSKVKVAPTLGPRAAGVAIGGAW